MKFNDFFESLTGNDEAGLEKKIRFKKQDKEYHQNEIDLLDIDILTLESKLEKLRRSKHD